MRARMHLQVFEHRFTQHTTFSLGAAYTDTRRPGELVEDTGLSLGFRRSQGYSGDVGFAKRISRRSSWNVAYEFRLISLEPLDDVLIGNETKAHSLSTGWSYQQSTVTPFRSAMASAHFPTTSRWSWAAEVSIIHMFCPLALRAGSLPAPLSLLSAGPRLSEDPLAGISSDSAEPGVKRFVTPDVAASFSQTWEKFQVSFNYSAPRTRRSDYLVL